MSAMQEREKLRALKGCGIIKGIVGNRVTHTLAIEWAYCDPCADIILSFDAEREAKARREAVEECATFVGEWKSGTLQGLAVRSFEENLVRSVASDLRRALLPSPATEKCEHEWGTAHDLSKGPNSYTACVLCGVPKP